MWSHEAWVCRQALGTSAFRLALQGPPAGSRVSPGCLCDLGVSPVRSGSLPLSSGNIVLKFCARVTFYPILCQHLLYFKMFQITYHWEFPGNPVVGTLHSQCREHGSPWSGNKDSTGSTTQPKIIITWKAMCTYVCCRV